MTEPSQETESASMASVFSQVYETNKWQGRDSGSGPGSSVSAARAVLRCLPAISRAYAVKTLLDAPCGDLHWMKEANLPIDDYIGVDVVPSVIEKLKAEHGQSSDRTFLVADITSDELPQADLVLCRDCLVHLTAEDAMAAIRHFKDSGSRLLLATTFYALPQNRPGSTGGWRPLNLQLPPFNFPVPELIVPERPFNPDASYSDKSLALWFLDDLPNRIAAPAVKDS